MNGGPDILATRMIGHVEGMEMSVGIVDSLGVSPLRHTWIPTPYFVTDIENGSYRIWNYVGKVYLYDAMRPRHRDKRQSELRLKWWEIEDHMKELGVRIELRTKAYNSHFESSIDMWEGNDCLVIDSQEEDTL